MAKAIHDNSKEIGQLRSDMRSATEEHYEERTALQVRLEEVKQSAFEASTVVDKFQKETTELTNRLQTSALQTEAAQQNSLINETEPSREKTDQLAQSLQDKTSQAHDLSERASLVEERLGGETKLKTMLQGKIREGTQLAAATQNTITELEQQLDPSATELQSTQRQSTIQVSKLESLLQMCLNLQDDDRNQDIVRLLLNNGSVIDRVIMDIFYIDGTILSAECAIRSSSILEYWITVKEHLDDLDDILRCIELILYEARDSNLFKTVPAYNKLE
ncbi:hypothetical protein K431DRAFT_299548 [Polychaeton citri CBS 116435]|uniref:Uncharacterized protein n=1 Tax=Polychaeton citri CBS 116435 TaxID=1314669 RepID=A0A9P4QJ33_9PEZI|nr:hypothetical protein K431DRAFT_299548 [Polychaeton citri CBS 116435]